jgi:hypothetical protein
MNIDSILNGVNTHWKHYAEDHREALMLIQEINGIIQDLKSSPSLDTFDADITKLQSLISNPSGSVYATLFADVPQDATNLQNALTSVLYCYQPQYNGSPIASNMDYPTYSCNYQFLNPNWNNSPLFQTLNDMSGIPGIPVSNGDFQTAAINAYNAAVNAGNHNDSAVQWTDQSTGAVYTITIHPIQSDVSPYYYNYYYEVGVSGSAGQLEASGMQGISIIDLTNGQGTTALQNYLDNGL